MPKYNSIANIPASVFFDIMKTKDYQQLKPKPKEKDLDKVFIAIYDDFFIKSDNEEAKDYLRLIKDIATIEYKIATLKQALHFYYYNQTTKEMRLDFINALKEGYWIEIDVDVPFIEEVKRVLTIEVGILQNDLSMFKIEYDNLIKNSQSKDFDYYDRIGVLSEALPSNSLLKENMTLAVYISLEKLARQKAKAKPKSTN